MLWRSFLSLEFGAKFQSEVPLFLNIPEFPYRSKEALVPKPSQTGSSVSIEHRLVTDRRTDTGPWLVFAPA